MQIGLTAFMVALVAQAWEAGMGTYRYGQTWVEPAVAR